MRRTGYSQEVVQGRRPDWIWLAATGRRRKQEKRRQPTHIMPTILLVLLILLLLGALPTWPYSSGWGYYPSGGLGLILLIVVILMLVRRV